MLFQIFKNVKTDVFLGKKYFSFISIKLEISVFFYSTTQRSKDTRAVLRHYVQLFYLCDFPKTSSVFY